MTAELLTYLHDTDSDDIAELSTVRRTELIGGIEELGMIEAAAAEIGLTMDMVADAIAQDPRLQADISIAIGKYRASVLRRLGHLAFRGSEKAIVGGRNKDQILGCDNIPNDKAMELISKMQFADELAIVTRQRIKAELTPGTSDEVKVDLSRLDRKRRKELDAIFREAQQLTIEGKKE